MKSYNISNRAPWFMAAFAATLVAGCAGLGSMEKELETLGLTATPEPLILRGDQVALEISGNFPAKYFAKKVSIVATPVLTWEGGTTEFESQGFQGEDAAGNNDVVPFETGQSFSYNSSVPFDAAMEDASTLSVRISATKGNSTVEFEPYNVSVGVITTPLWVQSDDKFILVPDNYERVLSYTQAADIHYTVNQSNVRRTELGQDDWNAAKELMALAAAADSVTLTGLTIESYASPEGEISKNEDLASDRAGSAHKSFDRDLGRAGLEVAEGFTREVPKGEDWIGFKSMMQASDIPDKNLILRVLEMYSDKNVREEKIRDISLTYEVIAEDILPALRRSQLVIGYDVEGYTDEEMRDLCMSNPEVLTVEELLFSATLFDEVNSKLTIYNSAARLFPGDFRGANNAGWCLAEMGRMNQAGDLFSQALALNRHKAVVNNVAAITRQGGDRDGAAKLLNEANGAGPEVAYNKGIIAIQNGDYDSAISNMGRESSVNVALAKLLNGDAEGAKTALENANDDSAVASYIAAIVSARLNDSAGVASNIAAAVAKDASLQAKSDKDLEFRNFRN
jgi:tetratricopeptide (TPR) repeat protein